MVTGTETPPVLRRVALTGATSSPGCSGTTRSIAGSDRAVVPGSVPPIGVEPALPPVAPDDPALDASGGVTAAGADAEGTVCGAPEAVAPGVGSSDADGLPAPAFVTPVPSPL